MKLEGKKKAVVFGIALLILVFTYLKLSGNDVMPHQVKVNFDNTSYIKVTIATRPADISRGLAFREHLPEDEGMLFVFEPEGNYEIWMQDMHFPLDVIWLNRDLEVVHLEKNLPLCAQRYYCKKYNSPKPAKYILEVNAGYIEKNGVEIGDTMQVIGSL